MPPDRANRLLEQQADRQDKINQLVEEERRRASDHQGQDQVPRDHQDHDRER
jgi:hypothetical protein